MLTSDEVNKVKIALIKNGLPFKYNGSKLITIEQVYAILNLVSEKPFTKIEETTEDKK